MYRHNQIVVLQPVKSIASTQPHLMPKSVMCNLYTVLKMNPEPNYNTNV